MGLPLQCVAAHYLLYMFGWLLSGMIFCPYQAICILSLQIGIFQFCTCNAGYFKTQVLFCLTTLCGFCEPSFLPTGGYFEVAACSKPLYEPSFHASGNAGSICIYPSWLATFPQCRPSAKVGVNLKSERSTVQRAGCPRFSRIPFVSKAATRSCTVTFFGTCPKIYLMGHRPTGRNIAATVERYFISGMQEPWYSHLSVCRIKTDKL